jgi:uncharacterized protein (TIGR00304 family)
MQNIWSIQLFGWIFLIGGIVLVVIALASALQDSKSEGNGSTRSRGLILIGPIPIVWGYGRKGWIIAGIIGVLLVLVWLLWFL